MGFRPSTKVTTARVPDINPRQSRGVISGARAVFSPSGLATACLSFENESAPLH